MSLLLEPDFSGARSDGDCLRVAVTVAFGRVYGFDYPDTPELVPTEVEAGEQQRAWEQWALDRNLRWWTSGDWLPVHLPAWIAGVASREVAGADHAIPCTAGNVILPADWTSYADLTLDDVYLSRWLLPAGEPMPPGRMRRISSPKPGNPAGIHYQVPFDNRPGWDYVEAEITGPGPKVGRNDPCHCGSGRKFKKCCGVA